MNAGLTGGHTQGGCIRKTSPTGTDMQEHVIDAYAFLGVICLPLLAWVVSRPPLWSRIRARLEPLGVRVWQQLVVPEPPDRAVLQRCGVCQGDRGQWELAG